jgi:hypothetical protein
MLKKLTKKQEEMLSAYRDMGIKIGMATGAELDEAEVCRLTDLHREM